MVKAMWMLQGGDKMNHRKLLQTYQLMEDVLRRNHRLWADSVGIYRRAFQRPVPPNHKVKKNTLPPLKGFPNSPQHPYFDLAHHQRLDEIITHLALMDRHFSHQHQ